jgi:nucleotide-binding universal stress UspA family protein
VTGDALHMLVALDLDEGGETVLAEALRYAHRMNAVVDIVHVAPPEPADFVGYSPGPDSVRDSVAKRLRKEHSAVVDLREKITQAGVAVGHALTIQGEIFSAVMAEVERLKPNILVMGQSHHRRFLQSLIRNPTEKAVQDIKCVMMIIPTS